MINFTTTDSDTFWKNNIFELFVFFKSIECKEYWTNNDSDILPFLIFFEIQLNNFKNFSIILSEEYYFDSFVEILTYLKIGTFFYLIYEINKEQPSFIISCILNCKQEKNIYENLFIERFQLINNNNFLSHIFNENKSKLIKIILNTH